MNNKKGSDFCQNLFSHYRKSTYVQEVKTASFFLYAPLNNQTLC